MIGANSSILDNRLQKIVQSGQLYDLLASNNGVNSPNTYIRGTNTIEYIFGTTNVRALLKNSGILPFNKGIISDHRALWIDLNISALFKYQLNEVYIRPPQMTNKNVKWKKLARQIITK